MALLLFLGGLTLCASAGAWAYSNQSSPSMPMKKTKRADDSWFDEDTVPTANVDCQNMSNTQLTWLNPDHRGTAKIEDWAGFKVQKCSTKPAKYTSDTTLFGNYYATKLSGGQVPPNHDPALTDKQSIDSSGEDVVENVIAGKKLELGSTGVLSLKTDSATAWSTPAGSASGTYTLKFDSNTYNAGNLCVFDKDGNTTWCMLPRVAVSRTASSTDGSSVNLAATQQSQLAGGQMKNNSDTAPRFAMIDDSGQFCMYRGTPGSIQGSSIICK